jgi:hypothetical protein
MNRWLAVLTISLCFLVTVPFTAALQVPVQGAVFTLPEENGNVILLSGTTYSDNGATYLLTNTSTSQIYAWYFPLFSMGNGTTMLRISAHDCNVTLSSFNSQSNLIGNNLYNRTRVLTCDVTGRGVAKIDFGLAINNTSQVYLDGVQKQQGDGWSYDNFGVTVTQPVSNIVIYSQYTDFVPPRDLPHFNPLTYVGIIVGLIIATLVVFGMTEFKGYRHKQKTESKPAA